MHTNLSHWRKNLTVAHNRNKLNVPGFLEVIFGSKNYVFCKNFWLPKSSVRKLGFRGFGCVFYFCLMRWYLGKFFFKFFYPRNAPPKLKLLEYIMICFVNFYFIVQICHAKNFKMINTRCPYKNCFWRYSFNDGKWFFMNFCKLT